MREEPCCKRSWITSGRTHKEACALSKKSGDLGCPRSAGCSMTYSAPASRAAISIATVGRTSSFASLSSLR
eukprot:18933-Pleurochrysis_carterae.AAC.1